MRKFGQAAIALAIVLAAGRGFAEEKKASFVWREPKIGAGLFTEALGMLEREREEYANSLAIYAANRVAEASASAASLDDARRYLALSMHLAPRNKRALVVNYQLSHGLLPAKVDSEYSSEVLARLLFTRAQVLKQQGGPENSLLARYFIQLAAELDPRNEDAVYACELQRLDHATPDWKAITDVPETPPADAPVRDGLP
jgi:hypothetical protein